MVDEIIARTGDLLEEFEKPLYRLREWVAEQRWESAFAALCLVAMLLGLAAEKGQWAPPASLLFYGLAYASGGYFGLRAGMRSLSECRIDVDLLMVLAALGAALVGAPFEGAMLLFLFSLSNVLQDFAMDRTRSAIRQLMRLRPARALVRRGQGQEWVAVEQVVTGDVFVVRPGDLIALDGRVVAGSSSVDQASLTGESMPVSREPGDPVFAGTLNGSGSLEIEVTRTARHSAIARLIEMVEQAQGQKARTQRFLERAEQRYALAVIAGTALAALLPPLLLEQSFHEAFYRAMTLMVAASPCALIISTPATLLSAIANGARRGVLFKGGVHLEQVAGARVVAFDKTGTLTRGLPRLTGAHPLGGVGEDRIVALAAAVEGRSEHPLARAVLEAARQRQLRVPASEAFQATPGRGVRARVEGETIAVGSPDSFGRVGACEGLAEARRLAVELEEEGQTCVLVARLEQGGGACVLGVLAFADTLRPGVAAVVARLKSLGVERTIMLTGDNERVARAIAAQAGVDECRAGLLPEDKVRLVRQLREEYGGVIMVGDGINDAPALATASVGMAMGAAGSDVALETADVVLMGDDLGHIPYAIALSRQARRTLVVNLGFALSMIALMVATILGWGLSLPLAVLGHEGGTVLVSLNGLRLLGFRFHSA